MSKVIEHYSLNECFKAIEQSIIKLEESGLNRRTLIIVVDTSFYFENDIFSTNGIKSICGVGLTVENLPENIKFVIMEEINCMGYGFYKKHGVNYVKYCNTLKIPRIEISKGRDTFERKTYETVYEHQKKLQ